MNHPSMDSTSPPSQSIFSTSSPRSLFESSPLSLALNKEDTQGVSTMTELLLLTSLRFGEENVRLSISSSMVDSSSHSTMGPGDWDEGVFSTKSVTLALELISLPKSGDGREFAEEEKLSVREFSITSPLDCRWFLWTAT